ncbi:MAG: recombinase family protein [Sphaerochaetaceae bacterium]|nr:recombinase family protein [Sphaerochaetaceae bacterium]
MPEIHHSVPACYYCRISSSNNKTDLKAQVDKCKAYARTNGLILLFGYKEIISGYSDILNRNELVEMLNRCHKQNIKHIVVTGLSRLTRSTRDGILLLDWFHRNGVTLHLCDDNIPHTKVGYLDLMSTLIEAEKLHDRFVMSVGTDVALGLYQRGRPPKGYKKDMRHKGRLVKDPSSSEATSYIFAQAIALKTQNPNLTKGQLAKVIRQKTNVGTPSNVSAKTIYNMIGNPIYTGRSAPRGISDYAELKRHPQVHEAYLSDPEYMSLRGVKKTQKLRYLEAVKCKKCNVSLNLNGDKARCPRCRKNISIKQLLNKMQEMCRPLIYDPDQALERQFENMLSISQLEALLHNIITQGSIANHGRYFVPPEDLAEQQNASSATIGEEWQQLKRDMKQLLMNSYNLVLNYKLRSDQDDEGIGLKAFIEDSFGAVYVTFSGRRKQTIEPLSLNTGIRIADNPFSKDQVGEDMEKLDRIIRERIILIRTILRDNPFLSDFLAYNIIDARFDQWEKVADFIEEVLKLNPIIC